MTKPNPEPHATQFWIGCLLWLLVVATLIIVGIKFHNRHATKQQDATGYGEWHAVPRNQFIGMEVSNSDDGKFLKWRLVPTSRSQQEAPK